MEKYVRQPKLMRKRKAPSDGSSSESQGGKELSSDRNVAKLVVAECNIAIAK